MSKRLSWLENFRTARRIVRARDGLLKNFEFSANVPAQQVIDAIERRWGRQVPTGRPGFHVVSTIFEQQAIVAYGHDAAPRIFAARIDFQSRDPAVGTLWFYDGEYLGRGTEFTDVFRAEFARLLTEVSPDATFAEHDGSVLILKGEPDPDWRARRGSHRKK